MISDLDSNQLFIVMEYIPGTDLKSLLKERGRLPASEAIGLMAQACAGIGYAHRAGLVHCDLKPQNILITPDNRVKVVDFGIARALSSIKEEEQVEVVWGSPQYFSPEQAAGSVPSPSSDVYSLGIVFFEMLTGQVPFKADTSEELARLHLDSLPPSPRKLNPAIPPSVERILLKVLAKEPTARYQTADQFGRVLTAAEAQPSEVSSPLVALPTDQPAGFESPVISNRTFNEPPLPDDTRRRRVLNILLLGTLAAAFVGLAAILVAGVLAEVNTADYQILLFGVFGTILGILGIYRVNRRYSGRLAALLSLLLLTAVFSFSDSPAELSNGRALFIFTLPITISSLILASQASFLFAFISSGIIAWLAISIGQPVNIFAIIVFFMLALVSWMSARSLESALDELRTINANLDKVVVERTEALAASLDRERVDPDFEAPAGGGRA